MGAKRKVTVSLDPALLTAVDQCIDRSAGDSRSALIERVLRSWYKSRRFAKLERETEAYYRSLLEAEREEDRTWSRGIAAQAERLWE